MNLFDSAEMAAGYATRRPPVHPLIVRRIAERVGQVGRALDVGCGAGLSTQPVLQFARECIGIDPSEAMIRQARRVAPGAYFAVAEAECLPVASVDLITAAGSLNYADLDRFFAEARRVLNECLVVYDFSQGHAPELDEWFAAWLRKFPVVSDGARQLDPDILAHCTPLFRLEHHELVNVGIEMTSEAYTKYMLTETNVTGHQREAREWCAETVPPAFNGRSLTVTFPGYIAYMRPV